MSTKPLPRNKRCTSEADLWFIFLSQTRLAGRVFLSLFLMNSLSIGIVGATGSAGEVLPDCLQAAEVQVGQLHLYASPNSAGKVVETPFGAIEIEAFVADQVAETCDIVFLCVSGDFSRAHARTLSESCVVIDASSAFRMDESVPLVIPEINGEVLDGTQRIIANPNCTTAILAMGLYPIAQQYGLQRVMISTYQAVSGAGQKGLDALAGELRGAEVDSPFQHPIGGNLIPHIDRFLDSGYTNEEEKVARETRRIFASLFPEVGVSCTSVRIPIEKAHSESVIVETSRPVKDLDHVRDLWQSAPGVEVRDDSANNLYPMPLTSTGKLDIEVGRLRRNELFGDRGLEFFVSGDQLLRGTSWNAALIARRVAQFMT